MFLKNFGYSQKNAKINAVNVTFINQSILETEDLGQQF
jgi:release factor glutamine methyltransferase